MAEKYIKSFTKGLFTRLEDESIPDGASEDSNNWVSMGDHIELRRGQTRMGTENAGDGNVSGLIVGDRFDGTQTPFHSVGRKIKYYDSVLEDWVETTTTDIIPALADGEDFCFDQYHSLAGAFVYGSSKNSGIYKIPIANPSSVVDLLSTSHRGKFRIKQNRMFLWDRKDINGGFDTTGLYGSYIDKDELSDYASILAETGFTGAVNSINTTYTKTLAFKSPAFTVTIATPAVFSLVGHQFTVNTPLVFATTGALPTGLVAGTTYYVISAGLTADAFEVSATVGGSAINTSGGQSGTHTITNTKRTCMYLSVYATTGAGTETFRDTRNGTLESNFGGTGTVNYATGAVSVTFANAPTSGSVSADYYWEDSTNQGIADFTKSTPRTAGQGFVFRQDDGGTDFQNLYSLGSDEYCLHQRKTWKLFLSSDDTDATNLIYRNSVGSPYWRAGYETSDGIYYADAPDSSEPYIRILKPGLNNPDVLPDSISDQIDLKDYRFDYCVMQEWGNYILVACRHKSSTTNNILFLYNKLWKLWDKCDYRISCMAIYNGALIAGDSAGKNVFTLFSDLTDEDTEIPNNWTSGKMDLDTEGVKYANLFEINGLIQSDQEFDIYFSYDSSDFVKVGTISGGDSYVDKTQNITVGSVTLGSNEVGGGSDGIEASPYRREFRVNTPRFEKIRVKFMATKVGYVSVSQFGFKDVRKKGRSLPPQYLVD